MICESQDMVLLANSGRSTQSSIFRTANDVYGTESDKSIWINGNREGSGDWRSLEWEIVNPYPFPGRMAWASPEAQNLGDCMMITNGDGDFKVSSGDCGRELSFICGFHRTL